MHECTRWSRGLEQQIRQRLSWSKRVIGLKNYELSPGWRSRVSQEHFNSLNTPEKILELIEKLDMAATKGRGPRYVRHVQRH